MHTRFFYAIFWLAVLLLWTAFRWLTGTSYSDIEDQFSFTEGKPDGVYHYISIYPSVYFDDESWYSKLSDTYGKDNKKEVREITQFYRDKMSVYLDTLNDLDPESWEIITSPYSEKVFMGDTMLLGDRVAVYQKADMARSILFKVQDSDVLFELDDNLIDDFDKEFVRRQFKFEDAEYYRFADSLNTFLAALDYVKIMHRPIDTLNASSLRMADYIGQNVYRMYDGDDELISENGFLIERASTKMEKDDFGDMVRVDNDDYLIWYGQWSYQWVAALLAIAFLVQTLGWLRLLYRKPKYLIHIDQTEGVFKFRIGSKRQIDGPFEIPLENFRLVTFLQDADTENETCLAIVFFHDSEVESESKYYHFASQDYQFDKTLTELESLPEDKLFQVDVDLFTESTSENKEWSFNYTLKGGEEFEFKGSYER